VTFSQLLVSDNGPQFMSTEFADFLQENSITHYKSPPYHPVSNGLAKNMVKNVKQFLKKESPDSRVKIKDTVTIFLRTYFNTPHTTTSKTPAELILKQLPRTRLVLTSLNINA